MDIRVRVRVHVHVQVHVYAVEGDLVLDVIYASYFVPIVWCHLLSRAIQAWCGVSG